MRQSTATRETVRDLYEPEVSLADQVADVVRAMVYAGEIPRGHRCHLRWRATAPKRVVDKIIQKVVVDVIDLDSDQQRSEVGGQPDRRDESGPQPFPGDH